LKEGKIENQTSGVLYFSILTYRISSIRMPWHSIFQSPSKVAFY